ncbi:MAG: hypothetical protein HC804_09800 [Anaerolineae bacterium]|nr:hypothetical protein [Anaerolineae bacterium]
MCPRPYLYDWWGYGRTPPVTAVFIPTINAASRPFVLYSSHCFIRRNCMQIQIPETLSARLRLLAVRRQQPVETIVTDRLFTALDDELDSLPSAEQAELRALHHLSDDALLVIAAEQMSANNQALMTNLMRRNSQGALSPEEQVTLAELVERGEQLMVRKAEAAAILVHRGHTDKLPI